MIIAKILRIEEGIMSQVKENAKAEHLSANSYIIRAIEEKLKKTVKKEKREGAV